MAVVTVPLAGRGAVAELVAARSRGMCLSALQELGLRVGRAEGTASERISTLVL